MTAGRLFDGQVVVVVGGGAGLGRSYCLELARQGASVVVAGRGESVADTVADIVAAGDTATAVVADTRDGETIVRAALDRFGHIDGMLVNAGIVRDRSFLKMTQEDWDEVLSVHLGGAFACTRAVWPHLLERRGGSILLTTSGAGLYGNFGQANYAAAKGAIVALTQTLAIEGRASGVRVNAVAPMAATGMTRGVFADAVAAALPSEAVTPFALALLHPDCRETGSIIEAGGGWGARLRWERAAGLRIPVGPDMIEQVLAQWSSVTRFDDDADHPATCADALAAGVGPDLAHLISAPAGQGAAR